MDATKIQYFQKELVLRFLPSTYAGHVGLAAGRPWWFMPMWKMATGDTIEFTIFRVQNVSA